jgi:hypothetical protein
MMTMNNNSITTSTKNQRNEEEYSSQSTHFPIAKRQKVDLCEDTDATQMGAKELASAFALASLATLSRSFSNLDQSVEARDNECHTTRSTSFEDRSPKEEAVPITPDISLRSKRVHFDPTTKDAQRLGPRRTSYPPRILHPPNLSRMPHGFVARGGPPSSRSMPPTSGYAPGAPPMMMMQGVSVVSPRRHLQPPPPPPSSPRHRHYQHRVVSNHDMSPRASPRSMHHHAAAAWYSRNVPPAFVRRHSSGESMQSASGPPPSYLAPPQLLERTESMKEWICDYCNVASFNSFQEACIHEMSCKVHCHNNGTHSNNNPTHTHDPNQMPRRHPMWYPIPPSPRSSFSSRPICLSHSDREHSFSSHPIPTSHSMDREHSFEESPVSFVRKSFSGDSNTNSNNDHWFEGSVSLANPDSDHEWLSELNCFIRDQCLEAFSAEAEDASRTSKRGRIALKQVGIRCRFCQHRPLDQRAVAAVSYPSSIAGIYESVKRWLRVHCEACTDMPESVRTQLAHLSHDHVWIPTTRQYWSDSAKALGMVDTEDGIRFSKDLEKMTNTSNNETNSNSNVNTDSAGPSADQVEMSADNNNNTSSEGTGVLRDGDPIVFSDDMQMVPAYVYYLMRQVEVCHFTEADRFVARSKGPIGFPGFQCRHCNGHAGLGKYFPVTSKSLSTNSTSQNIHAHLLKCRKCTPQVKEQLKALKDEKTRAPRLEPGWRRVFFDKLWERLHGDETKK